MPQFLSFLSLAFFFVLAFCSNGTLFLAHITSPTNVLDVRSRRQPSKLNFIRFSHFLLVHHHQHLLLSPTYHLLTFPFPLLLLRHLPLLRLPYYLRHPLPFLLSRFPLPLQLFHFTTSVPSVIPALLLRLAAIREWIASQTQYRFFGSSLLFIYEFPLLAAPPLSSPGSCADSATGFSPSSSASPSVSPTPVCSLIDFGHVHLLEHTVSNDDGYLYGLDRLIAVLREILSDYHK